MSTGARFDRHARLVSRMADALGVDLDQRVQEGEVLPEEVDVQVFNCMGCTAPDACGDWIKAHGGNLTAAPAFCRNKETLERLARR